MSTRQLIGPTNVGFCVTAQGAPGGSRPVGAYGSLPTAVLADFGLAPCPASGDEQRSALERSAGSVAAFAEPGMPMRRVWWSAAQEPGELKYADLRACPSCSFGNAPVGTVSFALTSVTGGVPPAASRRPQMSSRTRLVCRCGLR